MYERAEVGGTLPTSRAEPEAGAPAVSVIVATDGERSSVATLVARLERVATHIELEVIVVDGGDENAADTITRMRSRRRVYLVRRTPEQRRRDAGDGLIEAIRLAHAPLICVLDPDLARPDVVEDLLAHKSETASDLVLAGRSFLVRRGALDLDRLHAKGPGALLETVCKAPGLRVSSVPVGESRARIPTGAGKARQPAAPWSRRIRDFAARFWRFGVVGATGLGVNTLVLALLADVAGLYYVAAAILATQASTLWNFCLTELWVFPDRNEGRTALRRLAMFLVVNNAALLLRVPLLVALTAGLGAHYLLSNLISLVSFTVLRFVLADLWIWARPQRAAKPAHLYDVHGIVTIASEVRLPEIERFRVGELLAEPTVRVRLGTVKRRQRPAGRASPASNGRQRDVSPSRRSMRYVEGLLGFGFAVEITETAGRTEVIAAPLLGRSPHVLYTNVVEPVLRWKFVSRGYALVHGACIAHGGRAFMITARTDTGKTTTTLKVLDRLPYSFVSDDLTIVCPDGRVLTYPKPLTISRHTVHAVRTPLLSRLERAGLVIQSRLHSRSGRRFAFLIAKLRLPTATINTLVQLVVPPPKYHVERLVPAARVAPEGELSRLIVIQRGGVGEATIDGPEALDILMSNCEDAYGFPPYAQIEAFLHSGSDRDLRSLERRIVAQALHDVPATLLQSETMDWWKRVPALVEGPSASSDLDAEPAPAPAERSEVRPGHPRLREWVAAHRTALVLLGIVVLAALPRFWDLGGIGFRGDEAVYAGQAGIIAGDQDLDRYFALTSRGNSNFLLYQYFLSFVYLAFGVSDIAARLVAATFSLLTVLVTFELGRTLYSRKVGLVAAGLLALSSYSILLGRLALLDSTLTFFFTLTVLCFAKWLRSDKRIWLYAFAAAAALTIQAKVTGGLVLVVAPLYLLVAGELRRLQFRALLRAALVFLLFLAPVFTQLAQVSDQFLGLLSDSSGRASQVTWSYYLDKLVGYEGYVIPAIWVAGLAFAFARRTSADRLLLVWVVVLGTFFFLYPLKAFNYLLPLVPTLALLGGRALYSGAAALQRRSSLRRARPRLRPGRLAVLGSGSCLLTVVALLPLVSVMRADDYVGLREAAYWLKEHTPPNAGVIAPSRGSAQYALAFYAKRDAYPFGRFRLATVLPGGEVRSPRPAPDGPSRDWTSILPPKLIANREVSYLVFYTDEGDDPPDEPIVQSENQKLFRKLVETYGGRLVYSVYHEHEARVWVYKVTKLLPRPQIAFVTGDHEMKVRGAGFQIQSRVTLYYHRERLGTFRTDRDGSFTTGFPLPQQTRFRYWLVAVDPSGNYGASTGVGKHTRSPVEDAVPQRRRRHSRRAAGFRALPNRSARPARPLEVTADLPRTVRVGARLPIEVRVRLPRDRSPSVSEAHVFLQVLSAEGETVRWQQRSTNTLGTADLSLAALEVPGYYELRVYGAKGNYRGATRMVVKVRRR